MKVNVSVVEYDENFRALVDFIDNCKPSSFL